MDQETAPTAAAPAPAPAAAAAPAQKSNKGKIIAIVCACVGVAIAAAVAIILIVMNGGDKLYCEKDGKSLTISFDDKSIIGIAHVGEGFNLSLEEIQQEHKESKLSTYDYLKQTGLEIMTLSGAKCTLKGQEIKADDTKDDDDDWKKYYDDDDDNDDDDDDWKKYYDDDDDDDDDDDWKGSSTSCKTAADCMEKLDVEDDTPISYYDNAIGSKGYADPDEYQSDITTTYVYKFSNGDKILVEISSYGSVELEAKYEKSEHTSNADLDGYDTVSSRISSGTVTFKELKSAIGTEPLISAKSDYSTKYLWVGYSSSKYLEASVNSKGIVTSVFGFK